MDSLRQNQLRQLLALTEGILQDAKQKEWESMMEKEQARRTLMEEFFQQESTIQETVQIEEVARQIMSLDKKIIAMAEAGKLEILKKMRNLSAGQNAVDAYTANSSR
ncbi:MAG TPA: flagellar protein FliT [Gammaproteobacteria bacterium]|nr:flagellar protein FliT [Gammaproteobacteria bacterium]